MLLPNDYSIENDHNTQRSNSMKADQAGTMFGRSSDSTHLLMKRHSSDMMNDQINHTVPGNSQLPPGMMIDEDS